MYHVGLTYRIGKADDTIDKGWVHALSLDIEAKGLGEIGFELVEKLDKGLLISSLHGLKVVGEAQGAQNLIAAGWLAAKVLVDLGFDKGEIAAGRPQHGNEASRGVAELLAGINAEVGVDGGVDASGELGGVLLGPVGANRGEFRDIGFKTPGDGFGCH